MSRANISDTKNMSTPNIGGRALSFETPPVMGERSQPPALDPRAAKGAAGGALRQRGRELTPALLRQRGGELTPALLDSGGGRMSDSPTMLATEPTGRQRINSRYNLRTPSLRHDIAGGGSANSSAFPAECRNARPQISIDIPQSPQAENGGATSGERQLLALLQSCGMAVRHLSAFRCHDAFAALKQLPSCHRNTGWWWCQAARAHFESIDYSAAAEAFEKARHWDPCRLQDMEVYSTVLWHLKRDVQLSHLAQETLALDRLSPATCCILGNFFSLQKEHENALRFCQRALQLDPSFEYAYTLCGHEYFANEDFQQGLDCYRHAIRLDPRHYQAWYGLGQIHYRKEQFVEAEHHFRRAAAIHRRSSVLQCYVGMALAKQGRLAEALQRLQDAVKLDPGNLLARTERAQLLEGSGRLAEALQELAVLRNMMPRDCKVHYNIGRVCRRLNQAEEAVQAFSTALALDPSPQDAAMIKGAMENMQNTGSDEEMR